MWKGGGDKGQGGKEGEKVTWERERALIIIVLSST